MAIKFLNIRSKEVRLAETEPLIAALWASSDHSPNITQGQDMGWRLAPEVVVEMKRIKQNYEKLEQIARRYHKMIEDLTEPDILAWISEHTQPENTPVALDEDYSDDYNDEIRRLEREAREADMPQETTTTTETEPTTTTTTTEAPEATTTTTVVEDTTTTTTTV